MSNPETTANSASVPPVEKVKQFPAAPGVYIMKDAQGVVLYVGKAKNLRNRAGHYFTKAAADDPAPPTWCHSSPTSIMCPPTAKSMPCSWRPVLSKTFGRASTSI